MSGKAPLKWILIPVAVIGTVAALRFQPWKSLAAENKAVQAQNLLKVGYLPVTCHLTCPVTDFASKTSTKNRFESWRFNDFPTIVETLKSGRLEATFMVAPLAMKMREQGFPVRIVYLGHRDGSTLMVRSDLPAKDLRDLRGKTVALPSKASNQNIVIHKLMDDQGIKEGEINFVEMAPPDMPGALAAKAIDAFFVGEPHPARSELDGSGRILYMAKDIWPDFISCVLVVHENLIANQPELVRDLVRGIAESGQWAETHREEAAKVAAPYFRQDVKVVRHVLNHPGRVKYVNLTPTDEEMMRISDMAVRLGILKQPVQISQLIDRSFIPENIQPARIVLND